MKSTAKAFEFYGEFLLSTSSVILNSTETGIEPIFPFFRTTAGRYRFTDCCNGKNDRHTVIWILYPRHQLQVDLDLGIERKSRQVGLQNP